VKTAFALGIEKASEGIGRRALGTTLDWAGKKGSKYFGRRAGQALQDRQTIVEAIQAVKDKPIPGALSGAFDQTMRSGNLLKWLGRKSKDVSRYGKELKTIQ
jgi:hypothetical protein